MNSFTSHVCEVLTSLDDRWRELVNRSLEETLIWKPSGSRFHTIMQLVRHFAETQDYMLLHALGQLEQETGYHAPLLSDVISKERLIGIINSVDAEKDEFLLYLSASDMDELIEDRDRIVLVGDNQKLRRVSRGYLVLRTIEHSAAHLGEAALLLQLREGNSQPPQ